MPRHGPDAAQCWHHGQAARAGPAELVDQENSEGIEHIGCYRTGERFRSVSLVNTFNVN